MPDNYYSEVNENGVVTPFRDLAAFPRSEQAVLGAKNFLNIPNKTETINGITWTVLDGVVTANGTVETGKSNSQLIIPFSEAGKSLIFNGSPNNNIKCEIFAWDTTANAGIKNSQGEISGVSTNNTDVEMLPVEGHTNYIVLQVKDTGTSVTNEVFKPMIRLGTDPDPTYVSYAMTNKELTEQLKVEATTSNTHVTLDSDIKYFVRQGNVVNFNIRFTTDEAITASFTELFAIPFKPVTEKMYFTLHDRNAPFKEVVGCFIDIDNKMKIHNTTLAAGSYHITGMYLCK